jgi:hypothetical protein
MDSALLHNLMAGAGSSRQFIGGIVVAVLYAVIGLLSVIGSILVFRRALAVMVKDSKKYANRRLGFSALGRWCSNRPATISRARISCTKRRTCATSSFQCYSRESGSTPLRPTIIRSSNCSWCGSTASAGCASGIWSTTSEPHFFIVDQNRFRPQTSRSCSPPVRGKRDGRQAQLFQRPWATRQRLNSSRASGPGG